MRFLIISPRYGENNSLMGPDALTVPFVACGDLTGFDSDKSYPLELEGTDEAYVFKEPVQPPIRPNYHSYQQRQKQQEQQHSVNRSATSGAL